MGHFTLERTFYTSVECPPEALRTSVDCPGGHSARGDILHSDTGLCVTDLSTVQYAAIQNKSKAIGNGAQVYQLFNRNGFPPLMSASYDGYAEVALLNINLQDKDRWSAVCRQEWSTCFLIACSNSPAGKAIFLACEEEHITWTVYSIDFVLQFCHKSQFIPHNMVNIS